MGNRTRPINFPGMGNEEANEFRVNVDIADVTADTSYFAMVDCACELVKVGVVVDGAVAAADLLVTPKIGGVAVTGGAATVLTAGSAAGSTGSATPSGLNVLAAGGSVELALTGAGAGGTPRGHVTLTFRRIGKSNG